MKRKTISLILCLLLLVTMIPSSSLAEESKPDKLGGTVSIVGELKFGEELTANTSSLTGETGTLSYTWKRGEVTVGINKSTYTTVAADIGHVITCEVKSAIGEGIIGTTDGQIDKADGPEAPVVVIKGSESPDKEILITGGIDKIAVSIGASMTGAYQYSTNKGVDWKDLKDGDIPVEILMMPIVTMKIREKETATFKQGEAVDQKVKVTASVRLMLPENKKLVGYNQESDKAWVMKEPSDWPEGNSDYITKLKNKDGYTQRELLYMYPATTHSAVITYYTDPEMSIKTKVVSHSAVKEGGVPDKVGTYYRKATSDPITINGINYPSTTTNSAFYVVDKLEGGTRRGFSLSLIQPNYKTSNGIPRGVDEPFASVDEGWSWDPATEGTPAKLILRDFHEEWASHGIPISQRAEAFTTSAGVWSEGMDEEWMRLMYSLIKKERELGGKLILPGYEQVEITLTGANSISSAPHKGNNERAGIYVLNYEVLPLKNLLDRLTPSALGSEGKYEKNPGINILGMEDKSLLLTGNGSLEVDGNVRIPAGIDVDKGVTLNVNGSLKTNLFDYLDSYYSRNVLAELTESEYPAPLSEQDMQDYTYQGSSKNPTDVIINLKGRVNIQYKDSYGIYSTGKIRADKSNLVVSDDGGSSRGLGDSAGIWSANSINIENSTVSVRGKNGSGSAISAGEYINIKNGTLTTSGYNYGLSVFGNYPGEISIQNFLGTIDSNLYALYAASKKEADPTTPPALNFSISPRANRVTPYGAAAGTFVDSGKTYISLVDYLGDPIKYLSASYVSPSNSNMEEKPIEPMPINYDDISKDVWYYDSVQYVAKRKLMTGISDRDFAPNLPMNRGMMITLLYRMAGEPATQGTIPFKDVSPSDYYANALIWAYQNHIAFGNIDGTFTPNEALTRQDLAVFLKRYGEPRTVSESLLYEFTDYGEVSDYAWDAMAWSVSKGIIQGDEFKNLNAKTSAIRAQVAAMIERYESLE